MEAGMLLVLRGRTRPHWPVGLALLLVTMLRYFRPETGRHRLATAGGVRRAHAAQAVILRFVNLLRPG